MQFDNQTATQPVFLKLRSLEELSANPETLRIQRLQVEDTVSQAGSCQHTWELPGFCEVCGQDSLFILDWTYAFQTTPNFRERLLCRSCGLNNRQRFALNWIKKQARTRPAPVRIYLYEQITPFFRAALRYLPECIITGSEYLGYDKKSGLVVNGIRHEDALALSFPDAALDLIASNDVLEHVPDPQKALAESARVLAPGGAMLFSIPFYSWEKATHPRALLENGKVRHLLPEQYHGNPVSGQGSLVFHDFGWDVLEQCRMAGFRDAYALFYHSLPHGYLGDGGQIVFVAEK
jgi:SAM-dependent methyltransferase